ncbi:MAG TPA: hypothetical protein VF831_11480, partial [Anaerolineales bacterium]
APSNTTVPPTPTTAPTKAVPTATQGNPVLTPAQQAAIDAVSKKYSITAEQIHVVSTEAVSWPNGCLGVVIPGVLCTDVIVDGFRIKLEANGQQFEIHTNQDGTNVVDAAQLQATLVFLVRSPTGIVQVVNPNIALGPTYNPAFNGFLPTGGSVDGTAYVVDFSNGFKAEAIDANGSVKDLAFIKNPTYGLAIWRGGLGASPLLAWGTQLGPDTTSSSLMISAPDGSQPQTLLTIDSGNTPGAPQIVAEFWSADGDYLYFSKEPTGIGGYIPFGGGSNLYQINIATKQVTEIIPMASASGAQTCLDAISGDYNYVADHCTQGVITVRDLQSGSSITITPQAGFTDYRLMGSARFSPNGDRVAFALALGNPDGERGWIAVGNSSGGEAKLILTGEPGGYYTILGWLDDQTLLLQYVSVSNPLASNLVYTLSADGSVINRVAEGTLLTVIDNH